MRVIYAEGINEVYSRIMSGEDVELYITGGATKQMLYQHGIVKYMLPSGDFKIKNGGHLSCYSNGGQFRLSSFYLQNR